MDRKLYMKGVMSELMHKPKSLLKLVQEGSYFQRLLQHKYSFSQLPTVDILEIFESFDETIENYTFLESTSWITDIALLKKFARQFPLCNYFEIGCWRGESLYNVAQVAKNCVSLSLSNEEMIQKGYGKEMADLNHFFTKNISNIKRIGHDSSTFNFASLNQKFDLIFIDGDHFYDGIKTDTQNVFDYLVHDQSIVVWHDYGRFSEKVRHETLYGILEGLPHIYHNNLYHVSNTLCAVYLPNPNFSRNTFTKFPTKPSKRFTIQVKTSRIE